MRDFRKLQVWEKAHFLVLDMYRITSKFPKAEVYGLTSQIRRSAASIPENIAEGCGKESSSDFKRYLSTAMGSASELEYELLLAHDLSYLTEDNYRKTQDQIVEVKRMLTGLINSIRTDLIGVRQTTS